MIRLDIRTLPSFTKPEPFVTPEGETRVQVAEGLALTLPPHAGSRRFSAQDVITFFLQHVDDIAVNLLASYIFHVLQSKQAQKVTVNQETVITPDKTEEEIKDAIKKCKKGR